MDLACAVAAVFAVEAEAGFMAVADRAAAVAHTVADTGKFRRRLKGINGRQIKLPAVFLCRKPRMKIVATPSHPSR